MINNCEILDKYKMASIALPTYINLLIQRYAITYPPTILYVEYFPDKDCQREIDTYMKNAIF